MLLSSSSDGTVKLWQPFEFKEGNDEFKVSSGNILTTFSFKIPNIQQYDTPTSVNWIFGKMEGVAIGYAYSSTVGIFDQETVS